MVHFSDQKEHSLFVEPNISEHPRFNLTDFRSISYQADIVVFLVAHNEFKKMIIESNTMVINFCGIKPIS